VAKHFRHAAIFGALDTLYEGETMRFVNDHDPLPLLAQIEKHYKGQLQIKYIQREHEAIVIESLLQPAINSASTLNTKHLN
jgi:uncharacterized protein (DUF2249 family)